MLPEVSMANAVRVRFAQVLYARAVYQSRSLISIPVRLQNPRSLNSQPFYWGSVLQVYLTVPFVYDSMLNLLPLFLHYPREIVSSVAHSAYSHFIQQNDVTYICTWLEAFQQSLTAFQWFQHFTFSSVKLYEFTIALLHLHLHFQLGLRLNATFTGCEL